MVLPVFSSGLPEEISGKIWWYYNCYPDIIGRPITSVLPLFYQWLYHQVLPLTSLRHGLQFSVIIWDGSSWLGQFKADDKVSCTRTQGSASDEARISKHSTNELLHLTMSFNAKCFRSIVLIKIID